MTDDIKTNVKSRGTWKRAVHMIVLAIAFNVAELVIYAVTIFQFLSALITGEPNGNLRRFGTELGDYVSSIVRFLTFASEEKPFPFAPWPSSRTSGPVTTVQSESD
jgi:hypothetical protein